MAMDDEERQSTCKRKAIVEAATTTFLHKGYLGTSMDEIAALGGVSKQTVYKHFADKERLFFEGSPAPSTRRAIRCTPRCSSCATAATWRPTCAAWRAGSSRSCYSRSCCSCAGS